jgi:hypothetical protein
MRRHVIRSFGLVGLVTAVALACASPGVAANSATFTDPTGDNEGAGTVNYAQDIVSVQVVSEDDGGMTFIVTVQSAPANQGTLFPGDRVQIEIDADSDPSTGDQGLEAALIADGQGAGRTPSGAICRLQPDSNQLACEAFAITSTVSPPNHVLTFTFEQGNWFDIRFSVFTTFPRTDGSCCNMDAAPNTGQFDFDVRADPDQDGVSGAADGCPTKPGGRFDTDDDGCPGPLGTLPPIRIRFDGFTRTSSSVTFRGFGVTEVPPGVLVKVKVGNKTYTRRGSGVIRGLNGKRLPAGLKITLTTSAPGFCSWQRVIRIRPGASTPFVTVSDKFLRPPGGVECI